MLYGMPIPEWSKWFWLYVPAVVLWLLKQTVWEHYLKRKTGQLVAMNSEKYGVRRARNLRDKLSTLKRYEFDSNAALSSTLMRFGLGFAWSVIGFMTLFIALWSQILVEFNYLGFLLDKRSAPTTYQYVSAIGFLYSGLVITTVGMITLGRATLNAALISAGTRQMLMKEYEVQLQQLIAKYPSRIKDAND